MQLFSKNGYEGSDGLKSCGFNFIDGLNGLTLGTGIIILSHYSFFAINYSSTTLYLSIAIFLRTQNL